MLRLFVLTSSLEIPQAELASRSASPRSIEIYGNNYLLYYWFAKQIIFTVWETYYSSNKRFPFNVIAIRGIVNDNLYFSRIAINYNSDHETSLKFVEKQKKDYFF